MIQFISAPCHVGDAHIENKMTPDHHVLKKIPSINF